MLRLESTENVAQAMSCRVRTYHSMSDPKKQESSSAACEPVAPDDTELVRQMSELADRKGVTRTETARRLGVSARTVFRWRSQLDSPEGVAELQPHTRVRVQNLIEELADSQDAAGEARGLLRSAKRLEALARELRAEAEQVATSATAVEEERRQGAIAAGLAVHELREEERHRQQQEQKNRRRVAGE